MICSYIRGERASVRRSALLRTGASWPAVRDHFRSTSLGARKYALISIYLPSFDDIVSRSSWHHVSLLLQSKFVLSIRIRNHTEPTHTVPPINSSPGEHEHSPLRSVGAISRTRRAALRHRGTSSAIVHRLLHALDRANPTSLVYSVRIHTIRIALLTRTRARPPRTWRTSPCSPGSPYSAAQHRQHRTTQHSSEAGSPNQRRREPAPEHARALVAEGVHDRAPRRPVWVDVLHFRRGRCLTCDMHPAGACARQEGRCLSQAPRLQAPREGPCGRLALVARGRRSGDEDGLAPLHACLHDVEREGGDPAGYRYFSVSYACGH